MGGVALRGWLATQASQPTERHGRVQYLSTVLYSTVLRLSVAKMLPRKHNRLGLYGLAAMQSWLSLQYIQVLVLYGTA